MTRGGRNRVVRLIVAGAVAGALAACVVEPPRCKTNGDCPVDALCDPAGICMRHSCHSDTDCPDAAHCDLGTNACVAGGSTGSGSTSSTGSTGSSGSGSGSSGTAGASHDAARLEGTPGAAMMSSPAFRIRSSLHGAGQVLHSSNYRFSAASAGVQ